MYSKTDHHSATVISVTAHLLAKYNNEHKHTRNDWNVVDFEATVASLTDT